MATALFLYAAIASHFVRVPVDVTIRVAVLSGVDVKPVALKKFTISGSGGDMPVRTSEQGQIKVSLEPGKYKLRSVEALNLGSSTVEWDYGFDVAEGKALDIVVTNEDGISKKVEAPIAASGGTQPETLLYRKYKNSVATVLTESGHGSGFLVDSSGLFLTNAHVVEGSKKFRVKLGPGKVYKADLVQVRGNLDLAVVRISPELVKDLPVFSLLDEGDKQPEEGEKVIALGSPLSQQNIMTTGIVSKVEKEVIISDVNINHGNSGGPLLDIQGKVLGVCTFGDRGAKDGPNISGIVSIKLAKEMIADIKSNIVAIPTPMGTEMPDFLDVKFQPTSIDPSTVKKPMDASTLGFPRLFRTTIDTPIWKYSRQLDYQRRNTRGTRKGKETPESSSTKFWTQYAGDTNYTLVSIAASPVSAETSGSALSHALFGKMAGKSKMEVRFDFRDMELYADGVLIEPVEFYRIHGRVDAENDDAYINDTYVSGYFRYRFDAFDPTKKYKLRIRKEEDPTKWDETNLDPRLVKKIYDSFADVRKFLASGS